jgi:hypothetical protein
MTTAIDLTEFRRLAETIAWCRLHVTEDDPKDCLRTLALRPTNLSATPDQWGNFDYAWETPAQTQAVISALADRRAELLRAANAYTEVLPSDLAGGRLLITLPEESDWCGLSEPETYGFIDALDVPAWDTWVCYLHEKTTPDEEQVRTTQAAYRAFYNKPPRQDFRDWQPPDSVSYILCWIPPQFLAWVEVGIMVNPMECIFWASDYKQHYNTSLLRELDAAGLLK